MIWTGNTNGVGYGLLYDRDTGKKELAHRVAIRLVEGWYPDDTVMHLCDNPRCVEYEHLTVGSPVANAREMALKGRSRNQWRQLTPEQAEQVRQRYAAGETQQQIADAFSVNQTYVSLIIRNRIIHLLPADAALPRPRRRESKPRQPRKPKRKTKLTADQVRQIRQLAGGVTHQQIAHAYGVSKATVTSIIAGRLWRDLE